MSYTPGWKPGRWSAICDVCGFRFHSNQLRKRWDDLMVCEKDWELRHPQDFLKGRSEDVSVPWVRPETEDTFSYICYLWGASGYSDLCEADCARADEANLSYVFLTELKEG